MAAQDQAGLDYGAITGFVVLCGLPVALVLSILYVQFYRVRVLALMGDAVAVHMQHARKAACLAHVLAGLAAAAVMTLIAFSLAGGEFAPLRVLMFALVYAWPVVLTSGVILAFGRKSVVIAGAVYLVCFGVVSGLLVRANKEVLFWQPGYLFLLSNGLPTLFVWLSRFRVIHVAAPLTLAAISAAALGVRFAHDAVPQLALALALAVVLYVGLLFGLVALVRKLYRGKHISDQSFATHAIWLLFASMYAAGQLPEQGIVAFLASLMFPFPIYVALSESLGRRFSKRPPVGPPSLLWLRFYALPGKTERLREALSRTWRYGGSVRTLADLEFAPLHLHAHAFLNYLGRTLDRRFVTARAALRPALDALDDAPDRDGRFRENDVFCSSQAWAEAFDTIVKTSQVVLIDLRGFTLENSTSRLQLDQVLSCTPAEHVVLLTDSDTKLDILMPFLERTQIQRRARKRNESHLFASPALVSFRGGSAEEAEKLTRALCAAAQRTAPVAPPVQADDDGVPRWLRLVGGGRM